MTSRLLLHLPRLLATLAALLLTTLPAPAINGGYFAGRNRLSQATVGIGTLTAEGDKVGLSRCTGVLIGPKLVLTAAHCVAGDPLASAVILYDGRRPVRPVIPVRSLSRFQVVDADGLPADVRSLEAVSLDTAVLRLAAPARGRVPLGISHSTRVPANLKLAGAGLSPEGLGTLKTTPLTPVAVTQTGLIVASTRGAEVCRGDSGGPVVADGPGGLAVWGVASAILTSNGQCGTVVLIAPAAPSL